MNNYKSFAELKEELGSNYDFKLYEMGISALKEVEKLQQENERLNGAIKTYDILLKSNVEENKQLKDNWNKLKDYIVKEYYMYLPLEASAKSITILIDKMQELEQGSDSK